jgi:hypothetical protein
MSKPIPRIDLSSNPGLLSTIQAKTNEEIICICRLCGLVYKERPFICKCRSNVFLVDGKVIDEEFIKDKE